MIAPAAVFLYLAVATSSGALAFLTGQRSSGRTPPEVQACYEQAMLLENVARELSELADEAGSGEGADELRHARDQLEDAIHGLRRGADLVV